MIVINCNLNSKWLGELALFQAFNSAESRCRLIDAKQQACPMFMSKVLATNCPLMSCANTLRAGPGLKHWDHAPSCKVTLVFEGDAPQTTVKCKTKGQGKLQ